MEVPPVTFIKTRRFSIVLLASCVFIAVFESFYTRSYAMPSFDYSWETPVSHFLGPFLGCLSAAVVNSVAPAMETLAVAPIKLWRTGLSVSLCVFQWAAMYAFTFFANAFLLDVPITTSDFSILLISTVAFQAIGMFSAALFSSMRVWIFPVLAFMACVGFGFNTDSTPRPHHLLVAHTPTTAVMAILAWVVAVIVLLTLRPSALEKENI